MRLGVADSGGGSGGATTGGRMAHGDGVQPTRHLLRPSFLNPLQAPDSTPQPFIHPSSLELISVVTAPESNPDYWST